MSAIYRYQVPVDGARHAVKLFGEIVHVGGRSPYEVEFWAEHSEGATDPVLRTFLVVGTGHDLPDDYLRHVGTHVSGPLVWHLIEVDR